MTGCHTDSLGSNKKKVSVSIFPSYIFHSIFFSLIFPFEQKCSAITFVLHIGCDIWKFIRRVNWTMAWIFYFNDALNIQQCSLHIAHSTVQCSAVQCNCILSNAPILYIFLVCSGVCVCVCICMIYCNVCSERANRMRESWPIVVSISSFQNGTFWWIVAAAVHTGCDKQSSLLL